MQKSGEMPGDRAVEGIGETPFPYRAERPPRPVGRPAAGEKSVEHQLFQFHARQLRGRAGDEPRAAPRNRNRKDLIRRAFAAEHAFLQTPAPGHKMVPLPSGKAHLARYKARFEQARDCEIDIVATEQNVVAHRDPLDLRISAAVRHAHFEQAEIRSAAPHVNHQDVANAILPVRRRIVALSLFQPPVERRLRLLDETRVVRKARFLHGGEREPLRRRIKGGGNGDGDRLGIELEARALPRKPGVPRCAKVL